MPPVCTGAAAKYRVRGLCGRQARVVQPEADAGCFRQKSVVKSFRRKARIARLGPFFLALFHRGKAGAQDDGLYGITLQQPQHTGQRFAVIVVLHHNGKAAVEIGFRGLRRQAVPQMKLAHGLFGGRCGHFFPPGGNHPAEHVAAQMDAFVQLQRKGLGGGGFPRRHHARDQINLPFRKSTSREKRPPRRYSVFCISTASSAGVA